MRTTKTEGDFSLASSFRKLRIAIPLFVFVFGFFIAFSQENVLVRIYSGSKLLQAKIYVDLGKYTVISPDSVLVEDLSKGKFVECKPKSGRIYVEYEGKEIGNYTQLELKPQGFKNIFQISSIDKLIKTKSYDDGLIIKAQNNELILLNDVNLENYIAGVVQSEIYGRPELIDIFKVQATISRTYALKNINKHQLDGYNLCDMVHCQAYNSRCTKTEVLTGVLESSGEILVDSLNELIETPFHSNSGGETANSEDVWVSPIPYLKASSDTFSFSMRNSLWEKKMQKDEWLKFFQKTYGLNIDDDSVKNELLNFCQDNRKVRICNIPLKQVRADLKLKSTFFSVETIGNEIRLKGRGYGHGVGLSQEGAIRMIELGFKYKEVLDHYYMGVRIIQRSDGNSVAKEHTW